MLRNVLIGLEFESARFLARLRRRRPPRRRSRECDALIEAVGLGAASRQISGGAVRRHAAAARHRPGAARRPRVLLLDEPFGALDPGIRGDMHALIKPLWREHGMTIFMVTHDINEAFELGTRLIVFDQVRARSAGARPLRRDHHLRPRPRTRLAGAGAGLRTRRRPASQGNAERSDPMIIDQRARVSRKAGALRDAGPRAPPPSRFQRPRDARLEGARGRGQAVRGRLAARAAMGARHGPARRRQPRPTRSIPTFARGELPHFAGINTFLKAPYVENVRDVGKYDAAVIGIPFDSGTTYRPGTRFGPQGIRRISALYTPYNYELGVDLREQMTLCDAGDVFTIPANLEKSFDQITPRRRARLLVRRAAADARRRPLDRLSLRARHRRNAPRSASASSISTATSTSRRRISTSACTPRPGTGRPTCRTCSATNLVQLGIGGWQVPRDGVAEARKRNTNVLTIARHREARPREDRRDRARARLEGRRRGLHLLRRRLASIAASCPAPAGRSPAASCRARR